jgi:hypothetical protein
MPLGPYEVFFVTGKVRSGSGPSTLKLCALQRYFQAYLQCSGMREKKYDEYNFLLKSYLCLDAQMSVYLVQVLHACEDAFLQVEGVLCVGWNTYRQFSQQ